MAKALNHEMSKCPTCEGLKSKNAIKCFWCRYRIEKPVFKWKKDLN